MPAKITPATTLARVQELYDAGNSFRKIAEMLAAEGVPPAGPRSRWHHANVRWCLDEIERQNGAAAVWGLSPQIRARLAAQGPEIEQLIGAVLQQLSTNLRAAVAAEMDLIRTETAQQAAAVRQHFATAVAVGGVWGPGDRPGAGRGGLGGRGLADEQHRELPGGADCAQGRH